MFTYDPQLLACLAAVPQSIADVLETMQAIEAVTADGDGLKWFNQLYFQVTQAVEARVSAGGFTDAAFLSQLDVQFAQTAASSRSAMPASSGARGASC